MLTILMAKKNNLRLKSKNFGCSVALNRQRLYALEQKTMEQQHRFGEVNLTLFMENERKLWKNVKLIKLKY